MIQNHDTHRLQRDILDAVTDLGEIDPDLALKVARVVLERLQERYGTQSLYIPGKPRYSVEALKQAYRDGEPVRSIARREGISRRTLYRILRS